MITIHALGDSIVTKYGDDKTIGEARYDRPTKWVWEYNAYRESGDFKRVDDTHQNRFGKIDDVIFNTSLFKFSVLRDNEKNYKGV